MALLDAIIIGGGISGLACARRLDEAGCDFRLISDRLGGRMYAGPAPLQNFGATYINADYRHLRGLVHASRRLRRRDACYADGTSYLPLHHPRILGNGRALCRLLSCLVEFRRHFNRFRAGCLQACQVEVLRQHPHLDRLVKQPALEFIEEHGLERLSPLCLDPVVSATVFAAADQINAFYFLASLLPAVVPTYLADFSGTLEAITGHFRNRILIERVVTAEISPRGTFRVSTTRRDLEARRLVVATPAHNTREFLPEFHVPQEHGLLQIAMFALHVRGYRHPRFNSRSIVYMKPGDAATALLAIRPDLDLVFAHTADPDLSLHYQEYAVVDRVHWKTAVQLARHSWRPLEPRPGLFTIGDYNICGLEDSYLTGLYAANRILA
jgi:glycine/D-amino acid oxidase-like deaminating enzyme